MSQKVYDEVVAEARRQGVDEGLALALSRAESGGNPNAVSPKGARGTMQVMPATQADLETRHGRKMTNVQAGMTYLNEMLTEFGDEQQGIAAYNTGPGNVRKAIQAATQAGDPSKWREHLPAQETRDYLTRIAGYRGGEPVAVEERSVGIPGINTIEDLKRLPGWDALSREGKLQAINRAGLGDLSEIPPDMFDQVTKSDAALGELGRPSRGFGGSSATPIPQAMEEAWRARFVDPIRATFAPGTSRLDRFLAATETLVTLNPAAAITAGAGATAAGLTSWWLGDSTLGGLLGGAIETAGGIAALGRSARAGKRVLKESERGLESTAARGAASGLRASEQFGVESRRSLRTLIKRGKQQYGPQIEDAIQEASSRGLALPTTHPDYQGLLDNVTALNEGQFLGIPDELRQLVSGLEQALRDGRAIPVRDLREIHNRLRNWSKYVDEFNPAAKTMMKFVNSTTGALNHATAAAMDTVPALRDRFRAAQTGWRNLVAEPERVLNTVLMPTVTPTQAFTRLFSLEDPAKLRMAGTLVRQYADEPTRLKLRLGFMQMLSDKTNGFSNPTAVMSFLKNHEAVLTQAGLFTKKELHDVGQLMRRHSITSIRNILEQGVRAKLAPAAMIGAAGAAGVASGLAAGAFTRNQETGRFEYDAQGILIAALATAAAPFVIRSLMIPRDRAAHRDAVTRVIGGATNAARTIFMGEQSYGNEDGIPEAGS